MNIGDITNGSLSPKHLKRRSIEQVNGQDARNKLRPDQQGEQKDNQDSVAISEEARKALAENQKKLQELERAREALEAIPQLSAERKREIQERIDSAYYTKPEILDKIASRIARDIGELKR